MDYQAQQHKVLPPLAATFAFHFAAEHLWTLYNKANDNIEHGDLELLPDVSFKFLRHLYEFTRIHSIKTSIFQHFIIE